MKDSEKMLGVIFLFVSVGDLIRQDWLGFALLSIAGMGLLISPQRLGLRRGMAIALEVVLFALVVTLVVMVFSR